MVYRPIKLLSCLIFLLAIAYGTNPGSVAIRDIRSDTVFAKVTLDSALYVTTDGDTSFVSVVDTAQVVIMDTASVRIASPISSSGNVEVEIQDQHTVAFDIPFNQPSGVAVSLTDSTTKGDYYINIGTGHGIDSGDLVFVVDSVAPWSYFGEALDVVVDSISLDRPLTFNFQIANTCVKPAITNMNVDGSTTRQSFIFAPPVDVNLDVTRIMFQMITTNAVQINNFGDIVGGLPRGIVFRIENSFTENYWNVKNNGEFILLMFDVEFYDSVKKGSNGLGGRFTYAGPSKHGVTVRVGGGDTLRVIIQDDLTSLLSFKMLAAGHVVSE